MPPKTGNKKEVWTGKADQTSSGLQKADLVKNKRGEIVSKKLSEWAKEKKPLGNYLTSKSGGCSCQKK